MEEERQAWEAHHRQHLSTTWVKARQEGGNEKGGEDREYQERSIGTP